MVTTTATFSHHRKYTVSSPRQHFLIWLIVRKWFHGFHQIVRHKYKETSPTCLTLVVRLTNPRRQLCPKVTFESMSAQWTLYTTSFQKCLSWSHLKNISLFRIEGFSWQLRRNKRSLSIYGLREDPSLCSFSLWLETRPKWRNLPLTQSLPTHWMPCVPLWNPFPGTT